MLIPASTGPPNAPAWVSRVHHIRDPVDDAGMSDDRRAGEHVLAVADRLPAAVAAGDDGVVPPLDRDGPHHHLAVGEEHAADLDYFVRGPADQDVEPGLDDGDRIGVRVLPVTEKALTVTRDVDPGDRDHRP